MDIGAFKSDFMVGTAIAGLVLIPPAAQQPTFRSALNTVSVYATVASADGRLVTDLVKDDFEILDNGRPMDITVFSNDPQPLTIALLLDLSVTMTGTFLRVREGALRFVDALEAGDRVRICTVGEEITTSPFLTGDKKVLARVLNEELWPGGWLWLWDSLDASMTSLKGEPGRRVVLALTSGQNAGSLPGRHNSFTSVVDRASREGFTVYAISFPFLVDARYRNDPRLSAPIVSLVETTGGGHFNLTRADHLGATFNRVAEELRHQYLIGFTPATLDGKMHKLQLRLKRQGLKARTRSSYFAGNPE